MKLKSQWPRWSLYVIPLAMVACLAGAAYVYQTGKNLNAGAQDPKNAVSHTGLGGYYLGHVDLESGLLRLVPLQPGAVTEIFAYEGQLVRKGDVLLKVQDGFWLGKVAEAQSGINIAENQLSEARQSVEQFTEIVRAQEAAIRGQKELVTIAELKLQRAEKLKNTNLNQPAVEEIEQLKRAIKAQEAVVTSEEAKLEQIKKGSPQPKVDQAVKNVELKKALLEQAREQLNNCTLTAPQDGLVLQIQATVGTQFSAQPNHPAIILAPNLPHIVRVEVDQEFASRISLGAIANIQDETNNAGPTYTGKVLRIGNAFLPKRSDFGSPLISTNGSDNRVLEVIVSLDETSPMPKLGQRMRVSIGPPIR